MYHNEVVLVGKVTECILYPDGFYKAMIEVTRMSRVVDRVPLDIPGWIMPSEEITGKKMKVIGRLWSPTKLSVLVDVIFQVEDYKDKNEVYLIGEVYRKGIHREVSDNKQLVDIVVRTEYDEYRRQAHVPCLVWNRTASWASNLEFEEGVEVIGRLQSRKYYKTYKNGTKEEIEVYEVSTRSIRRF